MATFNVSGMPGLENFFDDLALAADGMIDEMLDAMADVVVEAQKRTASTMLQGPFYRGGVAGAVAKGRVKKSRDGKVLPIEFIGTQHGEELARIAYINEYGKTNQPARPFIATANAQCEGEAVEKAAAVFEKYTK
mgnify:CR=1 FL=1